MKIKIFGERNCGTRALQALVETNLGAHCLPGTAAELDPRAYACSGEDEAALDAIFRGADAAKSWKHCATRFEDVTTLDDCLTIFLVKHPLAWLASLFDRPYHMLAPKPATLAEFAATQWRTVERERLECRAYKPLDLYRQKLESYFALAPRVECTFLRFEDVVLRPEPVLRSLGLTGQFVPLTQSTKDPIRNLADLQLYYGEERWRMRVSEVTEQPDWEQVQRFAYN